jgi:LmbE family N-acetylglucosaminyl deacetylase
MQVDSDEVQHVKTQIRYSEARSAARVVGCHNLHFLNMPFYETGLPFYLDCTEAARFLSCQHCIVHLVHRAQNHTARCW